MARLFGASPALVLHRVTNELPYALLAAPQPACVPYPALRKDMEPISALHQVRSNAHDGLVNPLPPLNWQHLAVQEELSAHQRGSSVVVGFSTCPGDQHIRGPGPHWRGSTTGTSLTQSYL